MQEEHPSSLPLPPSSPPPPEAEEAGPPEAEEAPAEEENNVVNEVLPSEKESDSEGGTFKFGDESDDDSVIVTIGKINPPDFSQPMPEEPKEYRPPSRTVEQYPKREEIQQKLQAAIRLNKVAEEESYRSARNVNQTPEKRRRDSRTFVTSAIMATHGSNGTPPNGAHSSSDEGPSERNELKAYMESMQINIGESVAVDKATLPLGTIMEGDTEAEIYSNVYPIKTANIDIFLHRLDFKKTLRNGNTFPLVNGPSTEVQANDPQNRAKVFRKPSDYTAFENRKMHGRLFKAFMEKYPDVFGNDRDLFCYDYAADLFSLIELAQPEYDMVLAPEEVELLIARPYTVTLVLQPVEKKLNVEDFQNNFNINLDEHDPTVIRFLEMATSRYAAERPDEFVMFESKKGFYMNPRKYGFKTPELGGGKYLAPGVSKTVVCVEGAGNAGIPAVVVDSKKSPFYYSMNLLEMVCLGIGGHPPLTFGVDAWLHVDKYIKRLECFPVYGRRQHIPITLRCLYSGTADDTFFDYGDQRISVTQYFLERYEIILKFPKLPLAITFKKVNGKTSCFPLELLYVADNQRVGNGNISSADIATIVKGSAVLPIVKQEEIDSCHRSLSFAQDGFMGNSAIQVSDDPLKLQARVLQPPIIFYNNGNVAAKSDGRWKLPPAAIYIRPGYTKRWGAMLIKVPGDRFTMGGFNNFVALYYQECLRRGIEMQPCNSADIWEIHANEAYLELSMKESAEQGLDFLLIGHPDSETSLHPFIKGLERKYSVVTQCIRTKTMNNVLNGSSLSLENIVAKTNVKLGGLNHNIVVPNYSIDEKVLFIGLGMNHPAGGMQKLNSVEHKSDKEDGNSDKSVLSKDISVLGFSANDGVLPNEFVGNFFFQPVHRDEKITVLDNLVEEVLQRFKLNRGYEPTEIIFYRSGASEGSFPKIIRYEVPILKFVVAKHAPKAKITVILPSKIHSFRFFKTNINPNDRSTEQNITPGTVMDRKVVGKVFPEFFLNSHLSIQGTAKTPKFTILFTNDPKASMDKFQRWTNALAYSFQIVTSPISLPAPVFIALRYADRGRQIYNAFGSSEAANLSDDQNVASGNDSPKSGSSNNGSHKNSYYKKSVDYNFTHRGLLRSKRINA